MNTLVVIGIVILAMIVLGAIILRLGIIAGFVVDVIIIIAGIVLILTGVFTDAPVVTVSSTFGYRSDININYSNANRDFYTDEPVYLKVVLDAKSNKSKQTDVEATLAVPRIVGVQTRYESGPQVSTTVDEENDLVKYDVKLKASDSSQPVELVIRFDATTSATLPITLAWDDNIPETNDVQSTLVFVE